MTPTSVGRFIVPGSLPSGGLSNAGRAESRSGRANVLGKAHVRREPTDESIAQACGLCLQDADEMVLNDPS